MPVPVDRVELDVASNDWSVKVRMFDGVGIRVAFKNLQYSEETSIKRSELNSVSNAPTQLILPISMAEACRDKVS